MTNDLGGLELTGLFIAALDETEPDEVKHYDLTQDDEEEVRGEDEYDVEDLYSLDWTEVRKVVFGVDSGAAVTIMRTEECLEYPLDRSVRREFRAANKTVLRTDGRRAVGLPEGGFLRAEVGPVSKNLLSVADLEDAGFHVQFSGDGQRYAVHKETGKRYEFSRKGRVYDLELAVVRSSGGGRGPRRQGGSL